MNEDNSEGIKIDVEAEQKLFSKSIESEIQREISQAILQEMPELPDAIPYSVSELLSPLPESSSYQPIQNNLDLPEAEVPKINLGIELKFDPEKETKDIKVSLESLQYSIDKAAKKVSPAPEVSLISTFSTKYVLSR